MSDKKKILEAFTKHMLTEGAETRNMNAAKAYLNRKFGYGQEQALHYIGDVKRQVPNCKIGKCMFLPAVVRMAAEGQLNDEDVKNNLNKYLPYAATEAHRNEYDSNLNGLSAGEFVERFSSSFVDDLEADKEYHNNQKYAENAQYRIVRIESFSEASNYDGYVNWCVTRDKGAYNNYTAFDTNVFYFCLRQGWDELPAPDDIDEPVYGYNEKDFVGENAPLDDYGLSMIAVSVNSDGSPNTITCRWNHDHGGNDHVMDTKQLSQVIGRNFYKTFFPRTPEEIKENHDKILREIEKKIRYEAKKGNDDEFEFHYEDPLRFLFTYRDYGWGNDDMIVVVDDDFHIVSPEWYSNIAKTVSDNGYMWATFPDGKDYITDYDGNKKINIPFDSLSLASSIGDKDYFICKKGEWFDFIDTEGKFYFGKHFAKWIIPHQVSLKSKNTKFNVYFGDKERIVLDIANGKKTIPFTQSYVIPVRVNGRNKFNYFFIRDLDNNWVPCDDKTLRVMSPWKFSDITQYYINDQVTNMRPRVFIGTEKYLLDEKGNLCDMKGNVVKTNPYNVRKESTEVAMRIVEDMTGRLITEGVETRNMNAAKAIVMRKKNCSQEEALRYVGQVKHDVTNSRMNKCKYLPAITRMHISGQLQNPDVLNKVNQYLVYVCSDAHNDEYDNNLNGLTANEFINRFGSVYTADVEKQKEELSKETYEDSGQYQIVRIPTFEDAEEYADYVDWCVTEDEGMYLENTFDGFGLFYFCLRKGWDQLPSPNDMDDISKYKGEGCPLDDYGLSMIAVSVGPDGAPNTITCRWNHKNNGNDHILSPKQLSKLIGKSFYEAFPPKSEDELQAYNEQVLMRIRDEIDYDDCLDDHLEVVNEDPLRYSYSVDISNNFSYDERMVSVLLDEDMGIVGGKWFKSITTKFENGGIVCEAMNGKEGLFDINAEPIINPKYDRLINCGQYLIAVSNNNTPSSNRNTIIDRNDNMVLDDWYETISYDRRTGFEITKKLEDGTSVKKFMSPDLKRSSEIFKRVFVANLGWSKYDGQYKPLVFVIRYENNPHDDFIIIDPVTFKKAAPWEIYNLYGYYHDFYNVIMTDGKEYLLDTHANLYDKETKELIKKNPYPLNESTNQTGELLTEAMSVQDIYEKYYADIDRNLYNQIVQSDPTYDGQKMGKYTKWLLGMARRGALTSGDLGEAKHLLGIFEKYRNRIEVRDVTQLHSMRDLYDVVKPFMEGNQATSKSDEKRQLKNGAEKVYEDSEWVIVIPHTEDAAKLYGKGTRWCTAADNNNMFDYYNNQGTLYININKKTGKKYQFHFESEQFMNELDDDVREDHYETSVADVIDLSEGAIGWYHKNVTPLQYSQLVSEFEIDISKNEECPDFPPYIGLTFDGERYVLVNQDGGSWSPDEFDMIEDFDSNGWAEAKIYLTNENKWIKRRFQKHRTDNGGCHVTWDDFYWRYDETNEPFTKELWFDNSDSEGWYSIDDEDEEDYDARYNESDMRNRSKHILIESQESKSISAAKKLLMNSLGYTEEQADRTVRIDIRSKIENLREPDTAKFILGVTRMFVDGELEDGDTCNKLNKTLKLVASDAHINEYDRNLNGLSAEELINRFADAARDVSDTKRDEVDKLVFDTPSNYKIVRIDTFRQAKKYGRYTDWCVTHYENNFNSYTQGGICQFYFCLRNGFENERKRSGKNCPLDGYGLSMIAVCVYPDGGLKTCTCRWNHDKGGNDNIMDEIEISKAVGVNFYKIFLPNTKFKDALESSLVRLRNGENPEDIFTEYRRRDTDLPIVVLFSKFNYLTQNGEFLSKKWFDWCSLFTDWYGIVAIGEKHNIILKNGKLLLKQWYDDCLRFREGFAPVKLGKSWNFVDENGNLLSKQWFRMCDQFHEGFATVYDNNGHVNFIENNGKLLSEFWYDSADNFVNGFAQVSDNGYRWNFVNKQGELISKQWYNRVQDFSDGFAAVCHNGKWGYIDQKGDLLSNKWFDGCSDFKDGVSLVELNGKYYCLDKNGKLHDRHHKAEKNFSDNNDGFSEGTESNKPLLTESQESKSISAAKKLLMNSLGYSEQQADHTVRIDIRGKIENLREHDAAKFILGVTRMFIDGELEDGNTCNKLNKTLKLVASETHINEYDRNLNGLSAEELINRFADAERDFNNQRRGKVDKLTFNEPSRYKIVRIDSFEQANKYGRYTSWCVTHDGEAFNEYTQHGINQFYFCLRQWFENEPKQVGKNAPLDDYGLSMIAVCVYPDGDLKTCTCRWNHDHGGSDNVMNEIEVSKAVGVNFYKTFLPNTKFKDAAEEAQRRLKAGERPEDVFEYVRDESEGMTAVKLLGMWNFIGKDGHYLSKTWFEICGGFHEGYAKVILNGKWNFIDKDGQYLSKTWYDWCENFNQFHEGYAIVRLGDKWNFIGKDGQYLSKKWFDWCGDFREGYANVELDGQRYKIDLQGNLT